MRLLYPIIGNALTNFNRIAMRDDRRSYTYGQILGGAMFLAEKIESATSQSHIGLLLPTSATMPMALLGAWLARRTAVPLNYLLNKDELAYIINDSGVDTILTVKPMLDFLGGPSIIPQGIKTIMLEDIDFGGLPPFRWPPMARDDDVATLLYTSGTSARPKGVMLTHGNLASNASACIKHAGISNTTSFFGVLPQFHSFGLTALTLIPLYVGSTAIYTARFIPKRIVSLIREHRPSCIMAVPSMYGALLSVKEAGPDDFKSIEWAISGGEALPDAIFDAFLQRFNVRLLEGYGLTETSPVLTWTVPTNARRHSCGPAIPGVTLAILDENNNTLPAGKDGEIVAAGPSIMKGYYRLPEQTADVFIELEIPDPSEPGLTHRRRFFRTGDIGHLDNDGFLFITGRKKEMLKVAGEIVFPREVEEVLAKNPAIKSCAVIGKSDGLRGEVPIAFVELNEGRIFDETSLRTWCRERMATFKVPREIRCLPALPRTPTGKVLKRMLVAE